MATILNHSLRVGKLVNLPETTEDMCHLSIAKNHFDELK